MARYPGEDEATTSQSSGFASTKDFTNHRPKVGISGGANRGLARKEAPHGAGPPAVGQIRNICEFERLTRLAEGVSAEGAEMKVEVRQGQIVQVIDGPFTGFRGEVKEVDEQTAKVAVQVFGRVTPMDLAFEQIILVPEI